MRFLRRIVAYMRILPRARRNRVDLLRWMWRRPQLLAGIGAEEMADFAANRVPLPLRSLAWTRVAAVIHCEFCLDIGAALWHAEGLDERKLRELHRYEESDAFDDLERAVLRFTDQVSATPAVVDPDLRAELVDRLGHTAVAELASTIVLEHRRSRLNTALGVRPAGFGDGLTCPLPVGPNAAGTSA